MPLAPATTSPGLVRIGEFVLNVPLREIYSPHLKDIVRIAPKSLAVLAALIEQQGQVVSSAALKSAVWPDKVDAEQVLRSAIATLRRALARPKGHESSIQTVWKGGYRLRAPISVAAGQPPRPWR